MKTEIVIPAELLEALPADLDLASASITTHRALCEAHVIEYIDSDIDDDAVVVVAAGYIADDGNYEEYYPRAASAADSAREYVVEGDWGPNDRTSWVSVSVWRRGYVLDVDGEVVQFDIDRDSHTVAIAPEEPACDSDAAHNWRTPYEVLGGIKENPGVWGHGGGVILREVCAHCGRYRVTDTWAQDPATGEQGLRSIAYEDADEDSERWIASLLDSE